MIVAFGVRATSQTEAFFWVVTSCAKYEESRRNVGRGRKMKNLDAASAAHRRKDASSFVVANATYMVTIASVSEVHEGWHSCKARNYAADSLMQATSKSPESGDVRNTRAHEDDVVFVEHLDVWSGNLLTMISIFGFAKRS